MRVTSHGKFSTIARAPFTTQKYLLMSGERDVSFESLVMDVVHRKRNATLNFFLSLPQIMAEIEGSAKRVMDLLFFIDQCCCLADGFATRNLVSQFDLILPKDGPVDIYHSLLPVLLRILEELGTFILPQLIEFSEVLMDRAPRDFINDNFFSSMSFLLDQEAMTNVQAAAFLFLSKFSSVLNMANLKTLMNYIPKMIKSPCANLRIAVVDSVVDLYEFVDDDARRLLCDVVIVPSLSDTESLVRSHVLGPITRTGYLGDEILTMAKAEKNWKVNMAFCGYCEALITQFPEFETIMFALAKDKVTQVRYAALIALADAILVVDNQAELVKVCELALRVKDPMILDAGCRLLRKLVKMQTSLATRFQPFICTLKDSKSVHVVIQLLKGLCPYLTLSENDKKVITSWMKNAMIPGGEWRVSCEAMKGMTKIARNPQNQDFAKTYLPAIAGRLESPVTTVRKAVVKYLCKYVRTCGWSVFQVIEPKIKSALNSGRVRIAGNAVCVYMKLQKLSPPEDINKTIQETLDSVKAKELAQHGKGAANQRNIELL